MSTINRSELVREGTSRVEVLAGATVALTAVAFTLGLLSLFNIVAIDGTTAGIPMPMLLGAVLALSGLLVVGFGVGSYVGAIETQPLPSAGLVAAVAFTGVWFVIGGLVGSQTLGLGLVGWVVFAGIVGTGAFVTTVLPREDIGSTVPAGALALLSGVVMLTGIIGPGWKWAPNGLNAAFFYDITAPVIVMFSALYVGWAAAKAYGGFGARGRHLGAHVLVYLTVASIIAILIGLVLFVVVKGLPGVLQGFEIGLGVGPATTLGLFGFSYTIVWPVKWPILMNGVALLNDFNGVLPAIVGTIWLVVGSVLFAVPLGIGTAIFLSEYAEEGRFTQVVEIATNALWSTPSIVFGLFGYAFLIPRFGGQKSLLAGMLTLGFMLLPLVVITSREAMLAVPDEYRDGSAALGVTKWQTIRSVVLPAALPGVVTGVILGVGRIAGETAPILLTMAGGTFVPGSQTVDVIGGFEFIASPPFVQNPALLQATSALPYQLYAIITAGLSGGKLDPWALALVLLTIVLSFYAIGIVTRYYFRKKLNQ
ncbi:phosphate ABC transporter permease PstA [Haloarchaeobius amylolyticus]|uniref:phosphate ABC transporter permease PstA n=1 Tax=Haloarchaeobius amylolyticus TaxID=1198296 RepID=UPI00226D6810|nr:phosphate ABC transporter permease PstA [Haloarchaeobius amylolyticus]